MSQSNSRIEIDIRLLNGGAANRVLPPGIIEVVHNEYANKYLSKIGAYPTKENIDFVNRNLSINNALIVPVWARGKLLIIPGMKDHESDFDMQELSRSVNNYLLH